MPCVLGVPNLFLSGGQHKAVIGTFAVQEVGSPGGTGRRVDVERRSHSQLGDCGWVLPLRVMSAAYCIPTFQDECEGYFA